MGILKIVKAEREGARLLVFIAGVSGSGKTKTALEIAYGMANGDGEKIGFLDTESGRGRLYADGYQSRYLYAEMPPPFSPARYIQAINEFAAAKVEVLIIDSGSHEFEGIGGLQDIAEAGNPRLPNWNKAKGEHKKFMSALLASPMHIILCLRAREKAKPEKQMVNGSERTVYVDMGLQPICEKNVMFEATVSLMMHDQGQRQDVVKCPGALLDIMGRGNGYIGQADGAAMRAWVDGAAQLDMEVENSRGLLKMAAENGTLALQAAWKKTSKAHKLAIGGEAGCPADLKESAAAFDAQEKEFEEARRDAGNGFSSAGGAGFDALNQTAAQMPEAAPNQPQASAPAPGNTNAAPADFSEPPAANAPTPAAPEFPDDEPSF